MKKNEKISVTVNADKELECYVIVKGKKVRCTREVYLTIKRPGRRENKRQQRARRPFINGKRCQGDCENCCKYEFGECTLAGEVSLNELPEDGDTAPRDKQYTEDAAIVELMLEEMYKILEGDRRCTDIFELMLHETPQRKIAEQLNISDGTVTYYIKKIRKKLEKFHR